MSERVLIIGSGPIVIGQAAEFDYSGTQACLACRAAGVHTTLVNSNPATIQTDPDIADAVYIEPLTVGSLEAIIERERPDRLIATVGGQTGLNLAVALDDQGILDRWGVNVAGTSLETIRRGEDRALFAAACAEAGEPTLPSRAVTSVREALEAAGQLGYPVMCRSAFALGGAGSGIAIDPDTLAAQVERGIRFSGSGQVLIEKSVYGWTEVEYEVIRDSQDNCMIVCNMENLDPMGIHTGESVVVAPSQTLSDGEYHHLRAAAIQVVRSLGVEGACNVQLALDRQTGTYFVIEVNPRLSRSSALASKATGYPIAKVATQIALGSTLPQLRNDITGTSAFFEPALDYVVLKIPRWPFDKFHCLDSIIGTSMRSTGEVMAIGRTFEEATAKALRSLDLNPAAEYEEDQIEARLRVPHGDRLSTLLTALRAGWEPEHIAALSGIHPWFVEHLLAVAAQPPFSTFGTFKMVDTCAGEFEARTPYFYRTTQLAGANEAAPLTGRKAIILGAGPIRIGQGIEFDYSTVHACRALAAAGVKSVVINNNPETVSTDYSTSDRLYFEPLDVESVEAVAQNEAGELLGIIPQFGGQTAINLVEPLSEGGFHILGTPPGCIDAAEDRGKASAVLKAAGLPSPAWRAVDHWADLEAAAVGLGFPVLLRPSYVLSGEGMVIARTMSEVQRYKSAHSHTPLARSLLVDQFLEDAMELNVDAVSDGHDVVSVIMEQLDECGIHSGDSAEVYPVQTLPPGIIQVVEEYTRTIAKSFGIIGMVNVQYAVQGGRVFVLEVNPRASRSVPFATKASGVPLANLAVRVILGERLRDLDIAPQRIDRIHVKNVVLPFRVFPGLSPILGPQMQSTGEAMGSGSTFGAAYWKSLMGAGLRSLPFGHAVYVSAPGDGEKDVACLIGQLEMAGCRVILGRTTLPHLQTQWRCSTAELDLSDLSLAVVLGRSHEDIEVLRRAVDSDVFTVTTWGGTRALTRALQEGVPDLCLDEETRGAPRFVA
ncbi:MAG TPA: carbamoyl-phosphate synthase large subunit [Chloroflexota bacterium]